MTQEWVQLDVTKIEEMNYTQLHCERYRLRFKVPMFLADPKRIEQRLTECEARLFQCSPN